MRHAATAVDETALAGMVEHNPRQAPQEIDTTFDPPLEARGAELAYAGAGDDDVPARVDCHGPDPTGQYAPYLETHPALWRDGERGGGRRANAMHMVAQDLTDADIAALAGYYASLPASR